VSSLLVVKDDKLVGIITERDALYALATMPD
ncbi:MAG TPA: CBS domain-containing protein, partial [Pyrodictium sp.]|nr:CBS domain-containing protein [Pyrodictium sp.]